MQAPKQKHLVIKVITICLHCYNLRIFFYKSLFLCLIYYALQMKHLHNYMCIKHCSLSNYYILSELFVQTLRACFMFLYLIVYAYNTDFNKANQVSHLLIFLYFTFFLPKFLPHIDHFAQYPLYSLPNRFDGFISQCAWLYQPFVGVLWMTCIQNSINKAAQANRCK